MSEYYVGLISGTSLDGVDAALVNFACSPPELIQAKCLPYPKELLNELKQVAAPDARVSPAEIGRLDARLGTHFAQAALALLNAAAGPESGSRVQAIGSHGQTIAHDPSGSDGYSTQLADPNRIAEITGITTVADFRRRDVAAGGQGAPLASAFHAALWRSPDENRAVLNLGGIANLTLLPANPSESVTGFDTGPANCLLDHWSRQHLGQPFDAGGQWASSGSTDSDLLNKLQDDAYFTAALPKSTATQYFSPAWLDARLQACALDPADVAATLVELSACTAAAGLQQAGFAPDQVIVCGGGAHNYFLLARLRHFLGNAEVVTSDVLGIEPSWVEATAFAWLARETLHGRAGNLASVTGAAGPRVLGGIYPANG